jgi:hypothetical protein
MKKIRTVLFLIAALFLVVWILGCFIFQAGLFIHIFIMTAAITFMQALIINPKPLPQG